MEELTDDGPVVEPLDDAPVYTPADAGELYPHARWTRNYRTARQFMQGDEDSPPDFAAAFDLLTGEAETGTALAMADLGRMYTEGLGREPDPELAQEWYAKAVSFPYAAFELGKAYLLGQDVPQDQEQAVRWLGLSAQQSSQYAQYYLNRVYSSIFSSTASLLYYMARIFQKQRPQPAAGIRAAVDSKLRRKIREKKIAMGHKPDDHGEQTMG